MALLENAIVRYGASGVVPGPLGARHPSITPFGVFRAGAGRGPVAIAAGNDEIFGRLCRVLGLTALTTDPRFTTNELRCRHEADLEALIETALSDLPAHDWARAGRRPGAVRPDQRRRCGRARTLRVAARHMVVTLAGPALRGLRVAGNPIKLSGLADPDVRPGAPALDADREAILAELDLRRPTT